MQEYLKKLDNISSFKDFANIYYLEMFSKENIENAIEILSNKNNYIVEIENDEMIQLNINNNKVSFLFDDSEAYLKLLSNEDDKYYYFSIIYLYVLYKYNPFSKYREALTIDNRNYILKEDYKRFITSSFGFAFYLNEHFFWIDFFNFIKCADSLNIDDLSSEEKEFFYKHIFKFKVNNTNYESLIDILNNYLTFYKKENLIYEYIEYLFKNLSFERINNFEKEFTKKYNNNKDSYKKVSDIYTYIYYRFIFENKDYNVGLKELTINYIQNPFIQKYFIINDIEMNNEDKDKIFLKRKTYNIDDYDYISKNIDKWNYDEKEHVILCLLNDSSSINDYLEISKLYSKYDIDMIIENNLKVFAKNEKIFNLLTKDEVNTSLILTYLEKNKIDEFLDYYPFLIKKNDPKIYAKMFECVYKYAKSKYRTLDLISENFVEIIKAFSTNKYLKYLDYILIQYLLKECFYAGYRVRNILNDIKNEIYFNNDLNSYNYGFKTLKELLNEVDYNDDESLIVQTISYTLNIVSSYEINPKIIKYKAYTDEKFEVFSITINEENIISFDSIYQNNNILKYILKLIYDKYYNNEDKLLNIDKQFEYKENEELLKQEEIIKNKSKKYFNDLLTLAKREEATPSIDKIDVEPHVCIIKDLSKPVKTVYFKVGRRNKYYVVKDYNTFIHNIIFKEDNEYGKNFIFNHSLDSFNERSKKLLSLFIGQGIQSNYNISYDKRYAYLSNNNLDTILSMFNNVYITYLNSEEKLYRVSSRKIEIEYTIDENYNFYCIDEDARKINQESIINGYDKIYYLSNDTIHQINIDNKQKDFMNYVINNQINVKYIKNSFLREIYSRYEANISVNPAIKEEFKLKSIEIDVFFDIEDGILKYNEEIKDENGKISIDDINKEINLLKKYSKYRNILDSFGFVDKKIENSDLMYKFISSDLTNLKEVSNVYLSENIKKISIKEYKPSNVYMSFNSGLLDVCFENSVYTDEELAKIMSSLKRKTRYVKLKDNMILKLSEKDEASLLNLVNELALDTKHLNKVQHIPLYQSLKLLNQDDYASVKIGDKVKSMLDEIGNYKNAKYDLPDGFNEVMRPYQKDAFKWIKTLSKYSFSGILADDMGLGKSLEIISVIASDNYNKPSLIVCPKSLIYNWKSEFNRWAQNIDVYPVSGSYIDRRNIMNNYNSSKKQIFFISYDSLKNDLELFSEFEFRYLILDEAQFIKNHQTLKAKSVKKIKSELRFVLTGTPIENSVIDLWSIFDFLMPNYLYNFNEFKREFESKIINKDNEAYERLIKKITPFILRRTKKEVLRDLPEKVESYRIVEMGDEQRKIYEALLYKTRLMMEGATKLEILKALTRLRQLCVDPSMFISDYNKENAKIDALKDLLEEYIYDHKMIIFSQFTQSFVEITNLLEKMNITYKEITGKTPSIERLEIANDFNENDDIKVVLVSLKAGGTGLNLVGADMVIHFDPWWNVAAQNQASDRAHRIGQKNIVHVIKLICKDSIEEKVVELQNLKKDLVDKLIADDDSNIIKLSNDDLKYLLN